MVSVLPVLQTILLQTEQIPGHLRSLVDLAAAPVGKDNLDLAVDVLTRSLPAEHDHECAQHELACYVDGVDALYNPASYSVRTACYFLFLTPDGRAAGAAGLYRKLGLSDTGRFCLSDRYEYWMSYLGIVPEERGKGYALQMLGLLEEEARRRKGKVLRVYTGGGAASEYEAARQLYARFGMRRNTDYDFTVSVQDPEGRRERYRMIVFEKILVAGRLSESFK